MCFNKTSFTFSGYPAESVRVYHKKYENNNYYKIERKSEIEQINIPFKVSVQSTVEKYRNKYAYKNKHKLIQRCDYGKCHC